MALLMNSAAWKAFDKHLKEFPGLDTEALMKFGVWRTVSPLDAPAMESSELIALEMGIVDKAARYSVSLPTGATIPTVINNGFVSFVFYEGVPHPPTAVESTHPVYLVTIPENLWLQALSNNLASPTPDHLL